MICEPIFEDPNSLVSLLQRAEARRAAGDRIPNIELAEIIQRHREKALPTEITEYLTQYFRGEIRGIKGPKLQSDAEKDFRFGEVFQLGNIVSGPASECFVGHEQLLLSAIKISNSTPDEKFQAAENR
jgi:hypothetical protein